jgi:alkylation response protein AidB-like acyl-CoA dehydrogenase
MSFTLRDDQKALQQGIRTFCEGRFPQGDLQKIEEWSFDRTLWAELAEMGIFSLRVAEDKGGLGLGMTDAALVFEELGRALLPGPLVWTHLAAGMIEGAATGETLVGGIDLTKGQDEPMILDYFASLDVVLLLRDDGIWRLDAAEMSAEAVKTSLDPLTPVHEIVSMPSGECCGDSSEAQRLALEGATLTAALQLGIAQATTDLSVSYAGTREQFNKPIGKFQAVKHMCADSFVRQEVARGAVYGAAATLEHPDVGDGVRAASGAKINAGDAAMRNSRTCIQVHGGMGFTWEIPAHFYLKRAWVLENAFGTQNEHADHLGRDKAPA